MKLNDDIRELKGIGEKSERALKRKGIRTIEDLLYYFPINYEDRSGMSLVSEVDLRKGKQWVYGIVSKIILKFARRKRMPIVIIYFHDGKKYAKAIFFNQRFLLGYFKKGDWISLYGEVKQSDEPDIAFNIVSQKYQKHMEKPVKGVFPIYERVGRLTGNKIRKLIKLTLSDIKIRENLPSSLLGKYKLVPRDKAIKFIHFPDSAMNLNRDNVNIKRLIFEECFFFQIAMAYYRDSFKSVKKGRKYKNREKLIEEFEKIEKIKLTSDQKKAILQIIKDFNSEKPMKRLLQGDVGSGKTLVALVTALFIINNGYQVAFMAPTEILASQHYARIKNMSSFSKIKISLLLGSTTQKQKREIYEGLKTGKIQLVIGTHSLFQKDVEYKNLAYVIIDEQHRFGVAQRTALSLKGKDAELLVMTATPIPRSLYLTLYSDLSVSVLKEFPYGPKKIKTFVVDEKKREDGYKWIYNQLQKGKQGFIVFPLVEESEKMDLKDLETEYKKIKKKFSDISVGMLHGKMNAKEKEKIRNKFEKSEILLLMTTSIIEVGIDVPSANFILIEHPERYGLAQIHQMRGRVGRKGEEGFCFLIYNHNIGTEAKKRLNIIKNTDDGFKIAEEDLKIRGSGNPIGKEQWGNVIFRIADVMRDIDILSIAKDEAYKMIENNLISDKIKEYINTLDINRKEVDFN